LSRDKVVRDGDPEVILSGQMQDEQGKINLNGLLGAEHSDQAQMWERLFQLLELPVSDWRTLRDHAERERLVRSGKTLDAGQQSLHVLWPLRTADLPLLGLSAASLARLQAFVTVLPELTTINVNTASAEVLYASLEGTGWAQAQDLVRKRASAPWKTLADLEKSMDRSTPLSTKRLGVRTDFFLLTGQLRIEDLRLQESALVSRKTQPPGLVWRAQTAAMEIPSQIRMTDPFSP
jgi:general secretion pathway protein K